MEDMDNQWITNYEDGKISILELSRRLAMTVLDTESYIKEIAKRKDVNPDEGASTYGDVKYADPVNKKYPIDTEAHTRAAWSYINMPKNAAKYNAKDLALIKDRIKAAAKKFKIEIAEE